MTELKITKGEAWVGGRYADKVYIKARLIADVFGDGPDTVVDNTELVKEAFNVANETDLTPRQLLEQRDELFSVLEYAANHIVSHHRTGVFITAYVSGEEWAIEDFAEYKDKA